MLRRLAVTPAVAALLVLLTRLGVAETPAPDAPAATPGFARVPQGVVHPGCPRKDFEARAGNESERVRNLIYEVWGGVPEVKLEEYFIGRFEVTNAQWKHYLDKNFRTEYVTTGNERLKDISAKHVAFRGKADESEWKAIFALNEATITSALKEAKLWQPAFDQQPERIGAEASIPKGLKLVLYRHRIPRPWYGWHHLSGLNSGREYVDPAKPPAEAFQVPDVAQNEAFGKARSKDFASYPARDLSPVEILAFLEWAGCQLPTEYEYERTGRADRPNSEQHTFAGPWDRQKQVRWFAWADNPSCKDGPLAVDDPSVAESESPFGARHLIGNVWELTRTFLDRHPLVTPEPPYHPDGLFNYALTAKGGSWGDGWFILQLSTRTGFIGADQLVLEFNNRIDSLGFRIVRHPRPGLDLALHSILRLVYSPGTAQWSSEFPPPAFALPRVGGTDATHFSEGGAPYIHVQDKAVGIAVAPLWATRLTDEARRRHEQQMKAGKEIDARFYTFAVLRVDVPFHAGARIGSADEKALREARKAFEEQQARMKAKKPAKGPKKKEAPEEELVPEPPPPDGYEQATDKHAAVIGLWREKLFSPGEWFVGYWCGFLALANKAMIPEAILIPDAR
ncbi:MAG: SUMF1/EgtB/PvdO family nonheme iron enzyme, partial [Planctomycetota bacterium]